MLRPIIFIAFLVAPSTSFAESTKYQIDHTKSELGFVYFMGDKPVKGRFPVFDAAIDIDFDSVSKSSLSVSLDTKAASAGLFLATDAMLGEKVLHAEKFPQVTFTATDFRLGPHPTVIVSGNLTIRDVTKPMEFTARLLVDEKKQLDLKDNLVVELESEFSRSAFGAGGFPDMVEDMMKLEAQIAIVRAQ